jgi:hypothetical protein
MVPMALLHPKETAWGVTSLLGDLGQGATWIGTLVCGGAASGSINLTNVVLGGLHAQSWENGSIHQGRGSRCRDGAHETGIAASQSLKRRSFATAKSQAWRSRSCGEWLGGGRRLELQQRPPIQGRERGAATFRGVQQPVTGHQTGGVHTRRFTA